MIAVDTNVLARYLLNDDFEQAKAAARLLAGRELIEINSRDAPRFVSASGDVCVTPIYDHLSSRTLKCAAPPFPPSASSARS